jgi:hypothetical protein
MSTRNFYRWCLVTAAMLTMAGLVASSGEIPPAAPVAEDESIQAYLLSSHVKAVYYLKLKIEQPAIAPGDIPPYKPFDPGVKTSSAARTPDMNAPRTVDAAAGASHLTVGGGPIVPSGGGSIAPSRARVLSALDEVNRDLNR